MRTENFSYRFLEKDSAYNLKLNNLFWNSLLYLNISKAIYLFPYFQAHRADGVFQFLQPIFMTSTF